MVRTQKESPAEIFLSREGPPKTFQAKNNYPIRFARLLIKSSIVEPERQYNPGDGINKRYDLAFYY